MNQKICLITPSLRPGGAERVISELANNWARKKNVQVYLILLTNQEEFYDIHPLVTTVRPTRIYRNTFLSKTFFQFWSLKYIYQSCRKIGPDSILSFNEKYNNLVILALLFSPFRIYVSDRSSPFINLGKFHNLLRRILYRKATGIIAQTEVAREVLTLSTGNSNIKVIPNPLRKLVKNRINGSSCNRIILNVGRNVEEKNQMELIELFNRCENREGWVLKILGNGPLKEALKARVNFLGLQEKVLILDFEKDIDNFFAEADIFAFTSLTEGFPNALSEAMAHGLACISYDCPTGPRDIIKDGTNGFLIPLDDNKTFTEKLNILMLSESTRLKFSKNAKEKSIEYSSNRISEEFYNFIIKEDEVNS